MRSWSAPGFKAVVGAAFSSSISDLVSNRQTRVKGNLCESSEPGLCILLGQTPTGPTSRSGTKGPSGHQVCQSVRAQAELGLRICGRKHRSAQSVSYTPGQWRRALRAWPCAVDAGADPGSGRACPCVSDCTDGRTAALARR